MESDKKIVKFCKKIYKNDKSGHGFDHIKRVLKNAKKIYENEGGDWQLIFLSVLFHDIHRVMADKQQKYVTPKESLKRVKDLLKSLEIDNSTISKVLFIVENHEEKEKPSNCLELNIVKDSDIIDSLGKIGLKRSLKYCKKNKIPIANKSYSLDCKEYVPDVNPISTCHYIYRTMLNNAKYLSTKTGNKLAKEKSVPLEKFLNQYYRKLYLGSSS